MNQTNSDDQYIVSKCKPLLIKLINNYNKINITVEGLVGLIKALHSLSNYPKVVIKGYISITSSIKYENKESAYCQLTISPDYLELSSGGSIWNEGVGSDSFSNLFYKSGIRTEHDIDSEIYSWIDMFYGYLEEGKLSIEDEAEFVDEEESEEED